MEELSKRPLDAARERLQVPKKNLFMRIARLLLTVVFILLQVAVLLVMILAFSRYFVQFYLANIALSLLVVLWILNKHGHPDYKIAWIMPIMAFPIFGGLLYLISGGNWASQHSLKRMERLENLRSSALVLPDTVLDVLASENLEAANQSRFILNTSGCPPFSGTQAEYLPSGERYFTRLLEELEKAQRYIFLEYFIIKEGEMWDAVLSVLTRKASQGVDVRVIYDDIGSMFTLPKHYAKTLQRAGVACAVFNPFRPIISLRLNNRDHRKICVIDGAVGFTGGLNLSDEYINRWVRFGHWKDTGILLRGQAVWSLTAMFLSCWDYTTNIEEDLDFYHPDPALASCPASGVVQPYTSNPGVDSVGAGVYLNLINRAKKYVYITTPYLVTDDTMTNALCSAARSGVDVRIITPHIPDKPYVFALTQAHYVPLLEAGVKIFEYTPGFIHAKTFAVDDEYGVVGTVNLDYRSLYLHYEDGVWLYQSPAVLDIRNDFLATQAISQSVALDEATRLVRLKRLYLSLLRVLAPLL